MGKKKQNYKYRFFRASRTLPATPQPIDRPPLEGKKQLKKTKPQQQTRARPLEQEPQSLLKKQTKNLGLIVHGRRSCGHLVLLYVILTKHCKLSWLQLFFFLCLVETKVYACMTQPCTLLWFDSSRFSGVYTEQIMHAWLRYHLLKDRWRTDAWISIISKKLIDNGPMAPSFSLW